MRTQDGRNFSGIFVRAIKISGDIESGEAFYCYVFYLITIHLFCTSDDRLKWVLFLRPGVHAQSGLDSLPYGLCSLFPFFPVVPYLSHFFHLKITLVLGPVVTLTQERRLAMNRFRHERQPE